MNHFWHRDPVRYQEFLRACGDETGILDVGAGQFPIPVATWALDWRTGGVDLSRDTFPMEDKSVPIVYCRHTIEDLEDPRRCCEEMSRVGHRGYLEVPSALSELTRGVEGREDYRGYCHHRYIFWVEGGVLNAIAKYPLVERIDGPVLSLLGRLSGRLESQQGWNTAYWWTSEIRLKLWRHDVDFYILRDYAQILAGALDHHVQSTKVEAPEDWRKA